MVERKPGSKFKTSKGWWLAEEATNSVNPCTGCAFENRDECLKPSRYSSTYGECSAAYRSDNKNIIFKITTK